MKTAVCGRGIPSNTRHLQLRRAVVAACLGFTQWAAAATIHVWSGSPADGPGTTWGNAFHAVQSGVDAAGPGDTVLVTNEVQVLAQTVTLSKAVTLRGVRGAIMDGNGAVRCLVLNHADTVVEGLTIRNGYTASIGGGICVNTAGGTIRECVISGCRAEYGGGVMFVAEAGLMDRCVVLSNRADVATQKQGGGVYLRTGVTVRNCLIAFNEARIGGGVLSYQGGTVQGCTIADNTATQQGGGVFTYLGGNYFNSVLYFNTAPTGSNIYNLSAFTVAHCCTVPDPGGTGNITDDPAFVNRGAGNYRTMAMSPCVDSGDNADAGGAFDLDGYPRIVGETVNRGCYEMPYAPAPVSHVSPTGGHVAPFDTWAKAATNLQDAVSAVAVGGEVRVTNGTYRSGATLVLDKALVLRSENGPEVTILDGQNAVQCVAVKAADVMIEGFGLTGGAAGQGGGLHSSGTGTRLLRCTVSGCSASEGGGVHLAAEGGVLEGCVIEGNTASGEGSRGGGLHAAGGATLRCCMIRDNAAEDGAGLYASGCLLLENCLVADNVAEYRGGGMTAGAGTALTGCTVARNSAFTGGGVCWLAGGDAANSILQENLAFGPGTNYLLEAGVAGFNYCCTVPLPETGSGNLAASPLFFDPGAGDYHPGPDSPCIDAGSDALAAGTGDLDGLPRINGVAVDMGAYEWASIHYVAPGGGHLSPFGSWATAATNIQEALDRARGGDRVLVSNGTYRIASALNISRGVTLVGIAGREATIVDAQNLCRCLVIHHASDVVEGFTFTRGYAPEAWGAGVHFSALGGTLRNCRVTGCTGDNGIGVHFSQAGGLVEGCLIDNNIRIMGGMDSYGAGVYFTSFGAEVRNCIITDNLANFGGAVYMPHGGTVANSVLARNYASQGGGAYCNWHQSFFYNCTIVGNSAIYGGGFLSSYGGTLESCILYHNTASLSGPNFYQMGGSSGFACYNSCCAQTPPGSGNITANPLLKNLGGGDYHLSPDSPCINAGLVYRGTIDLDGNPRVAEGVVDMGAYERPGCYYVAPAGAHRVPYASWDAAATNLQAALDEAHAGAKVLVTNGVYAGNLAAARAVTLESVEGRGATSITGGDIHPCATLGAAVTLDGFTLEHGCGEQGGGLHVAATGATIRNCLVRACAAPDGAGIYFASGTGTVENCILRSNQTSGSPGRGGGLFLRPGVEIVGSVLEDNQATEGGGAYLYQGGALRQCRVATNAATSGGGAYLYQGGAVDRCRVTANQAASGGGLYVFQSGTAVNSLLAGNGADNGAGAYFNYGGALRHCTLGGNTAAASGGGVFCKSGTLVQNTILWDNAAGAGGTNWYNSGTGMTYEHCCTAPAPAGAGHVTADPRLAADGVHLLYSSPCADAGKVPDVPVSVDLDGAPRPVDGSFDGLAAYDIGASEYDPETADSNGDGVPDGWCHDYGLDPLLPGLADGNPDGDPFTTGEEWTADTNPTNGASFFRITGIQPGPPPGVWVDTSDRRVYTLQWRERFEEGGWQDVPGQVGVAGTGGPMGLFHEGTAPANGFYRVKVAP